MSNPYEPAKTPPGVQPGNTGNASQMISTPAILVMVAGGIGILTAIVFLGLNVLSLGVNAAAAADQPGGIANMMSGTIGIVFNVISIATGAFIIFAGLKMKNLENYTLSMIGAIIAMIPCITGCCLVGLPAGIWALVVMNNPEVKSAFRS